MKPQVAAVKTGPPTKTPHPPTAPESKRKHNGQNPTHHLGTYRLDVMASNATDVIQSIGGWLCDRALSGWRVTVTLASDCDSRSLGLRILGVQASASNDEWDSLAKWSSTHQLAIAASVCSSDQVLRRRVQQLAATGLPEVTLWGHEAFESTPTSGVDFGAARFNYRLSSAARAFKALALQAEGLPPEPAATESLCRGMPSVLDGIVGRRLARTKR